MFVLSTSVETSPLAAIRDFSAPLRSLEMTGTLVISVDEELYQFAEWCFLFVRHLHFVQRL
jgi:hypothetical protein